jgi:predicted dinucleotide-binding enzyme
MEINMTDEVRNFIDLVASGDNSQAKDAISELLSTRAFETLDAKKQEMAATLFNGTPVEQE